jgi:F-type H+-transporting ATPase subunit a
VTTRKKRGCLGCSLPVLIILGVVVLALVVVGFLSGGIGQKLLEKFGISINMPSWLVPSSPEIQLPAPVLFHVFGLPITNTIIAGWITIVFLVIVSWLITRRMKLVPGRVQTVFEFALGWIYDFCNSVAGEKNGRRFFPVVCTIFLFIIFNAWLSLIPGFGSILIHIHGQEHELLRGANTDLNTPLAIALVSFGFVTFYGLKSIGMGFVRQYIKFGPLFHSIGQIFKGKFNFMDIFSSLIEIFVGLLELLSMFIRIISFTFRLFGNMTAGEVLLLVFAFLLPMSISWLFYSLELLVGFIQALVFSGLTLAFMSMAVTPHEEEAHKT